MKTVSDLMERTIIKDLDTRVRLFLYDLICLQNDTTDDDIKTYLTYEANDEPHRQRLMMETMKACKLFKAKYLLLKRDLPRAEDVLITISAIPGQINPHVLITEIPTVTTQARAGGGTPGNTP